MGGRRRHRRASSGEEEEAGIGREETHRPAARRTPRGGFLVPLPSLLVPTAALLLFVAILLPPQLIAQPLQPAGGPQTPARQQRPQRIASHASAQLLNDARMALLRQRRQSKPQEGIWQLYFRLMREGSNDTVNAFQQIRQLFSTLIEPERPRQNLTTTEKAPVTAAVGGEDEVDDGAASNETTTTTTTEPTPRKISTGELMTIFRRNVFGLGRLFGREFWNAIQQSNKNIQMYSREWQEAIRPFVAS